MIVAAIDARITALVNNCVRVRYGIIDDVILPKANPVLLEFVRKDKQLGDMEGTRPMHNMLQSSVDPLLDDERSANQIMAELGQIMAELGFVGKPVVFDKSMPFCWDKAGLRNAELLGKS